MSGIDNGKICKKGWIKPTTTNKYYQQVYVYTIYPDKTALIEYSDGKTQYVDARNIAWNCCCASRILFRDGCQCGGE